MSERRDERGPTTREPEDEELQARLEALRRSSGLRLDREGRFLVRDAPITHAKTVAVLHAGIDRTEGGEYTVRIGREWAYLEVEDSPLFVVGLEGEGDGLVLRLSDGSREPLRPDWLWLEGEDALYTLARGGAMHARFLRAPWSSLAAALVAVEDGAIALPVRGSLHVLARTRPAP